NFRYFKRVLCIISSPPFYTKYVHLPSANSPLDPFLAQNPKFASYFDSAVAAIDGTHI
ncbi:hypothetical protein C8Q79DRAFT_872452, partial [Trametes meyenii]